MNGAAGLMIYLPKRIASAFAALPEEIIASADEIRLRRNGACSLTCGEKNLAFDARGRICRASEALRATEAELTECLGRITGGSLYTCDSFLAQGFIPLGGGGRAGICGRADIRGGKMTGFTLINSITLRVHRFISDMALPLAEEFRRNGLCGALVISPPGGGKTTFLRSAAYLLSQSGATGGFRVAIADERSEIAAAMPPNCGFLDVLSGINKSAAIEMLTRTMSPQAIICDEISASDSASVAGAVNCGAAVIASAHGAGIEDVSSRPGLRELVVSGAFKKYVLLSHGKVGEIGNIC